MMDAMQNDMLIKKIIMLEWGMFKNVQNEGGTASCQNNPETFSLQRSGQFMAWNSEMLQSYLDDLLEASKAGRNLLMEKYARMMETTFPEEYAKIADQLPAIPYAKHSGIDDIAKIQVAWMEECAAKYPEMARRSRYVRAEDATPGSTSYETYLKGELATYSMKTIQLYQQYVHELQDQGLNMNAMIMENTAKNYGYPSLEKAEETLAAN